MVPPPPPDPYLLCHQPRWDERSDFFRILTEQFDMITPEFLRDLSIHVGVYDLGSFMEFFLQSRIKMADIFPGLMMVTHGARIRNCGILARWLKESPTSPLPIQLRTNSHPDWFRIPPDLITIDRWTPTAVSTFSIHWTRNRTSYERDMSRAAAHASDAYLSQSLQLRAAYQVAQDQPSPMETHYANSFSNYMRAIQQVSPHPTQQAQE
jgi:hypothetical protein